MHQLAVAAMGERPPRIADAEAYLTEAIGLERSHGGEGLSVGGRAATLQQLARVASRRGDRAAAHRHLLEALRCLLYTSDAADE